MNAYRNKIFWKTFILVCATLIGGVSLYYTNNLTSNIAEEDLANIWVKFYKVDKARTREYGGNGIGLSIVKAIMEQHNEKYGVENHLAGVEFWFELSKNDI